MANLYSKTVFERNESGVMIDWGTSLNYETQRIHEVIKEVNPIIQNLFSDKIKAIEGEAVFVSVEIRVSDNLINK